VYNGTAFVRHGLVFLPCWLYTHCLLLLLQWLPALWGFVWQWPQVAAGGSASSGVGFGLVLRDDGRIYHFGSTDSGVDQIPDTVQGNAVSICAGEHHAAAVTRDGVLVTWVGKQLHVLSGIVPIEQPPVTLVLLCLTPFMDPDPCTSLVHLHELACCPQCLACKI
jgi:hypothetical protein